MEVEVAAHEKRDHWEVVKRSSVPLGTKTIQAIWSFKRKRFPDGSINKFKARLCAHGGMQQWGVNYWETYTPVVNWIDLVQKFNDPNIDKVEIACTPPISSVNNTYTLQLTIEDEQPTIP